MSELKVISHLVGSFSKGGTRTLCGLPLAGQELARNGQPTCADCRAIDDRDAASLLTLTQDTTPAPSGPVEHFSSTSGYRPKGTRHAR